MGAYAHHAQIVPQGFCGAKTYAPVQRFQLIFADFPRPGMILAPGKPGRAQTAGIGKQLLGGPRGDQKAMIHHRNGPAHVVGLVPVMGDHEHGQVQGMEKVLQFDLQFQPQMGIQG